MFDAHSYNFSIFRTKLVSAVMLIIFQLSVNKTIGQIVKFRTVEIDTAYFSGTKPVPAHKSYPDYVVSQDLDKATITIYRYPKENCTYALFSFEQYIKLPSNTTAAFKARAVDEANNECNFNMYVYKGGKCDARFDFLYSDKGIIVYLKRL